jgi:hypothetical protein
MAPLTIPAIIALVVVELIILLIKSPAHRWRCKKCKSLNNWSFKRMSDMEKLPKLVAVNYGTRCNKCGHFEEGSRTELLSKSGEVEIKK